CLLDVNRRWPRLCLVRRARSPKAAEAQDEPVTRETARRSFELLDCLSGVALKFEGAAFDDEARCAARGCGLEQGGAALAPRAVVRIDRCPGQVGDEVDDRVRPRTQRELEKGFGVVDIADGGFRAEIAKDLQLLRRSCQGNDLVTIKVRQRGE